METRARWSMLQACLVGLIVLFTLGHWLILGAQIPVFTSLQWWFWEFTEQPLDALWIGLPLAVVAVTAIWTAVFSRARVGLRLAVLIVLGFGWQHGLALLEGRGIDGVRDHIRWSGHAQFARAAARQEGIGDVIRNYEDLAPREVHGKYAKSKPPGTLLLYVLSERAAGFFGSKVSDADRLERLQNFASYTWPFLCYWVLVPMAGFARRYLGAEAAMLACGLYLFVPSVSLMTLHTDQTFYPLLAFGAVYLGALAGERDSWLWAAAAGVWLYLAVFCSFGLIVVAPLAGAMACVLAANPGVGRVPRLLKLAAAFIAGFIAVDVSFRLAFGYDIAVRYHSAIAHHVAWKFGWEWSVANVSYIASLDTLETIVWLGVPLFSVAGWEAIRALQQWARFPRVGFSEATPAAVFSGSVMLVFLALLFLSRTKGEAARLWLFLVPFICLVAARALARWEAGPRRWWAAAVMGVQAVTVVLTKAFQDF